MSKESHGQPAKQLARKLKNGNPANLGGRPKGSSNKRTMIRKALQAHFPGGEQGLWGSVATMAARGDMQAIAMLVDRLTPRFKPTSEPVTLKMDTTGTPAEMARQVLRAVADGELTPDQGRELLAALADVCRVIEVSELENRIIKLEMKAWDR